MKFLQKLGKAIMFPVAVMPLCGLLMGIGYLLCPASMQGGEISGIIPLIGLYLVKAGGALIDHIPLLFAIGVAVGLADERDGTAGLAALVSWLLITTLLKQDNVAAILPNLSENASLAFAKIENPFIGILAGLLGAFCYNRFKNTTLPDWLAFFSGKRSTVIIAGAVSVLAAAALLLVWPAVFGALIFLGEKISSMGYIGAGIYAFLNRLLIPFGLHHALNNVFWFDTVGLGDLSHFWAGHTSADVTWSLGVYMSGFFPCMMFGVPGAALAMVHSAKAKKTAVGILLSGALCAFVCGVTEPFEFSFMFAAPLLYAVYSLLYGIFTVITAYSGFRAGFAFSAGVTDLFFSASLPAAQKTWLIIPLGIAAYVCFYLIFRVLIRVLDLKTPGREEEETQKAEQPAAAETDETAMLFAGLGGKENIVSLDNCVTRLRLEVKDMTKIDEALLKQAGSKGVIKTGKDTLQVVIGTTVQQVADAMRKQL